MSVSSVRSGKLVEGETIVRLTVNGEEDRKSVV